MLTQVRLFSDGMVCGLGRQHPCRDLKPSAIGIENGDCSISTLRSTDKLESRAVQGVEWIQDLHIGCFHAQGIVSVGAFIRISIA